MCALCFVLCVLCENGDDDSHHGFAGVSGFGFLLVFLAQHQLPPPHLWGVYVWQAPVSFVGAFRVEKLPVGVVIYASSDARLRTVSFAVNG